MACFNAPASLSPLLPSLPHHLPSSSLLFTRRRLSSTPPLPSRFHRSFPLISPSLPPFSSLPHSIQLLCRAAEYAEYKFPDPIPEFAEAVSFGFDDYTTGSLPFINLFFFFSYLIVCWDGKTSQLSLFSNGFFSTESAILIVSHGNEFLKLYFFLLWVCLPKKALI